jgi:hypothetical protein
MTEIKIISRTNCNAIVLPLRIALLCGIVSGMVETTYSFMDNTQQQFNLDLPFDTSQAALDVLNEYLTFHGTYNAEKYKSPTKTHVGDVKFWDNDQVSAWDKHFFMEMELEMLRDVYNLGDFLDIPPLTDVTAFIINRKYLRPLLNKYPVDEEAIRNLQMFLRNDIDVKSEQELLAEKLSKLEFSSKYAWAVKDDFGDSNN